MRRGDVMQAVLAGLLGCAARAPGRDIPVYREYSQPIFFYDEQGERTEFAALAPDLAARRAVRDSQAQEAMMGKETLLDLTFGNNESVFGRSASPPAMLAPRAGGGEDGRRRKDASGQNWLAKSLSLPSLGQTSTNAAASAMSAGAKESSWGWLADEVAGQTKDDAILPEDRLSAEGYDPASAPSSSSSQKDDPYGKDRAVVLADKKKAESGTSSSGAFPERVENGQKPSDRSTERGEASVRNLAGGDGMASKTMQSYRAAPAMAEMSQTRQMLAEFSAGSRPDFAALRASLLSGPADSSGSAGASPSGQPSQSSVSSPEGASLWGSMGSRSAIVSGSMGSSSPGAASWQGNWSAQNAGGGLISRFETAPNPVQEPLIPATKEDTPRPGPSGGGYKPAWF
jgi:hypothetical protein